jgi:hypothetical protein
MAHPSENNINRVYSISGNLMEPVADGKATHFYAVYCSVDGDIDLYGSFATFVDVSALANDAAAQAFINPDTGVAFTDKAEAVALGDGSYERINTSPEGITMSAGDTIYGKFLKLEGDGVGTFYAYAR